MVSNHIVSNLAMTSDQFQIGNLAVLLKTFEKLPVPVYRPTLAGVPQSNVFDLILYFSYYSDL